MNSWISPREAADAMRRGRGRGVRIAVLDSGIEANHPALNGLQLSDDIAVVLNEYALEVVPGGGRDIFGHGTAIAGIIRELAPEAEIGSFRVLGDELSARTPTIVQGAREALKRGYHILNCSFGCRVPEHVLQHKRWVDAAYLQGVHVVAACNNQDFGQQEWPGFFTSVMTVNMTCTEDRPEVYYKPGHLVEFAARGVDVDVAWSGGGRKKMTGSSFAAPRVAGMLACLLSEVPDLDPQQAKVLFRRLAKPWTPEIAEPNQR